LLILGIDTSGKTASCALCTQDSIIAQYSLAAGHTHSQVMPPMIKRIFEDSGRKVSELDLIAVSCGPGSYTGLRIGIATAKAMAFGINETAGESKCSCCGVSALLALAYNFSGTDCTVCAAIHARKNLAYTAMFRTHRDGTVERLTEDAIFSEGEIAERINAFEGNIYMVGDMPFSEGIFHRPIGYAPMNLNTPSAVGICMAAVNLPHTTPAELMPAYLQQTLAEKMPYSKGQIK